MPVKSAPKRQRDPEFKANLNSIEFQACMGYKHSKMLSQPGINYNNPKNKNQLR